MLFFYFYLISFSLLGYGLLTNKILNINLYNFGYLGLLGISLLTIISYSTSLVIPHNHIFNSLVIFFGIFSFVILYKKIPNIKKEFFNYLFIFAILAIFILLSKNHDDFSYYHFPYSYYLTQFSALIGIGQFNNGFRVQSSIFYLNSIFYLPVIKYYMFNISVILIMGFSNLILLSKIFKNINSNNINFNTYLSLLSFIFINIFFYRIGEHGSDRSAQILIFLLIIIIFDFIKSNQPINNFFPILVLMGLIISLKAFYILYLNYQCIFYQQHLYISL